MRRKKNKYISTNIYLQSTKKDSNKYENSAEYILSHVQTAYHTDKNISSMTTTKVLDNLQKIEKKVNQLKQTFLSTRDVSRDNKILLSLTMTFYITLISLNNLNDILPTIFSDALL